MSRSLRSSSRRKHDAFHDASRASARDGLAAPGQRRFGDALSTAGLVLAAAGALWMILQDDDRVAGIVLAVLCFVLIPVSLWPNLTSSRLSVGTRR